MARGERGRSLLTGLADRADREFTVRWGKGLVLRLGAGCLAVSGHRGAWEGPPDGLGLAGEGRRCWGAAGGGGVQSNPGPFVLWLWRESRLHGTPAGPLGRGAVGEHL